MTRLPATRVMVVDAHPDVREGFTSMLDASLGIDVVGEAGTVPEALRNAEELQPEVILLDIRLREADGVDLCRQLRRLVPRSRTIVLTSYSEEDYLFHCLRAGAWGYLAKTASHGEMVEAIESAARGKRFLSAPLLEELVARYSELAREKEQHDSGLEPEEIDILRLLAEGASRAEIAQRLQVSGTYVEGMQQRVFKKLGVTDRGGAMREALRRGLV